MSSDKVSIGNHLLYDRSIQSFLHFFDGKYQSAAVRLVSFVNGVVIHMLNFVKTGKTLVEIEKKMPIIIDPSYSEAPFVIFQHSFCRYVCHFLCVRCGYSFLVKHVTSFVLEVKILCAGDVKNDFFHTSETINSVPPNTLLVSHSSFSPLDFVFSFSIGLV